MALSASSNDPSLVESVHVTFWRISSNNARLLLLCYYWLRSSIGLINLLSFVHRALTQFIHQT